MIISFSVQNFGSIKEKQTLSFEADKSKHLEKYYVVPVLGTKLRLLKLALIYGANASGKTTILKALDFLKQLAVDPVSKKSDQLDFHPFLFDSETPQQNSILSIEFIQANIRYSYEVEFNRNAIVQEELYYYSPKRSNLYKRTTNLEHQLTEIQFGPKAKVSSISEQVLTANTLWNNTVLGGYLKTNLDIPNLKYASDWFDDFLYEVGNNSSILGLFLKGFSEADEYYQSKSLQLLSKADFKISRINIRNKELKVPTGIMDFFEHGAKLSKKSLQEIEKKAVIEAIDAEVIHKVGSASYSLDLDQESEGTKRYFSLSYLLILLIGNKMGAYIDELESSLHPDLYMHFLLTFLVNSNRSQIIATTHNREILEDRDLFRNDAIWFTEKNEAAATELFSLADFDTSVIRKTTSIKNVYKAGKLGAVPNLGDYYIDIEVPNDEEDEEE